MIVIRFPDSDAKRRALGFLVRRFTCTTYRTGEMLVPPDALGELAMAGIPFSVEGPATYRQSIPAYQIADSAERC